MTTAFFLRHGLTRENTENRVQGQQPGTLQVVDTERYVAAIVPLLREKNPDIILSSDLDRAIRTRHILKRFLQLSDVREGTMPLLRERAMGYYEGMLWDEVPEAFRAEMSRDEYNFRRFGGENNEDVRERVRATLRTLAIQYDGKRVVCVTHAGWLRELVQLADTQGVVPDGWTHRQAIYEAGLGANGTFKYFHPTNIEARIRAATSPA